VSDILVIAIVAGGLLGAALLVGVLVQRGRRGVRGGGNMHGVAHDLARLERERSQAAEILERMTEGVLVLDGGLRPTLANRAARSILGLQQMELPHRLPSEDVVVIARRAYDEEPGAEGRVNLWYPSRRTVRVRAAPLGDRSGVVVVLQDISEEMRAQRIRTEFVAHASHELKSPVASIQALAEAVRQAARDDAIAAERLSGLLMEEADRLGRLTGDLLDLSRLESPDHPPRAKVDFSAVARRVTSEAEAEAAGKNLDLSASIDPGVWVVGDDQQLTLMIRNLIDNAIRYTQEGGAITVTVAGDDDEAILSVADTGGGIPLEAQERVFERFYRVDRARSRERGGTGLGLAIVKHAVELHGGTIELASELGTGSTFTVRLPTASPGRDQIRSVAG
jgi:two-component system phosphate regulon sensor histidine kinase PhoR